MMPSLWDAVSSADRGELAAILWFVSLMALGWLFFYAWSFEHERTR